MKSSKHVIDASIENKVVPFGGEKKDKHKKYS